jgi:hypothetical protein
VDYDSELSGLIGAQKAALEIKFITAETQRAQRFLFF